MEKTNKDGYILDSKRRRGTLHRRISEQTDGEIPFDYHVHHCDFIKTNNKPDNLVQIPSELHRAIHKNYTYKPSKKEILEKILPQYLEIKGIEDEMLVRRSPEDIIQTMKILSRQIHNHPERDYILKKVRKLLTKRKI